MLTSLYDSPCPQYNCHGHIRGMKKSSMRHPGDRAARLLDALGQALSDPGNLAPQRNAFGEMELNIDGLIMEIKKRENER
jgi:hypothetical protein